MVLQKVDNTNHNDNRTLTRAHTHTHTHTYTHIHTHTLYVLELHYTAFISLNTDTKRQAASHQVLNL